MQNLRAEARRAAGLRCMGIHMCVHALPATRGTEKERERDDDAIPAGGWRRVGGECQDSGGGGLEFPLLYAVDFAFERVAGSTTSLRPTTVCRLSGVDLPGGCEYDLFRGSRRFIGA